MMLSRNLIAVSDGLSNLTIPDQNELDKFFDIPRAKTVERIADHILEMIHAEQQSELANNATSAFCPYCEQNTPHTLKNDPRQYYECTECGIITEVAL